MTWQSQLLPSLLAAFDVPQPASVRRATRGTQSDVWILDFATERLVLKSFRRGTRASLDRINAVMERARSSLPIPRLRPSRTGDLIVQTERGCFTLSEHARGEQPERSALGIHHAASMGDALRRLHAIPAAGLTLDEEASAPSTTEVLSRIEALLGVIPVVAPGDRAANEHLKSRARWLEAQGDYHPSGQRHSQLVHGDYIDANLFFHDGDVSAVIDWDAAHHGSAQHELMRSAHYSLRDNGELWAAFLRAYVAGQPLDLEQLDAAAKAYAYRRDRSLWQFEEFYLRGNAAVRQYLPSATFVPWIERWRRIRAHLA